MKQSNFTESQIVAAIKKQESGTTVKEICREQPPYVFRESRAIFFIEAQLL